jgi:asparagine synthase (glutamine-hydrolysing)
MTGIAVAMRVGPQGPADDELASFTRRTLGKLVRRRDGMSLWSGASATLGQVWWATTPEDMLRGGDVARLGQLVAVGDVRIDNRDEILPSLGLPSQTADLDLLLAAWARWGDTAILRVVGDYAAAIWNREDRSLSLLRDAMGARGLYLARRRDLLLVVSEMHALGTDGHVNFELDRLQALRFMIRRYDELDGTLFVGVEAAPAGGVLRISDGVSSSRRLWAPDPFSRLQGSPNECAERFGHVFRQAIAARTRATGTLAVTVSGGLDSSAVACVAAREAPTRPTLLHFSFSGMKADESEFFSLIADSTGCPTICLDPRDHAAQTLPSAGRMPGELHGIAMSNYGLFFDALPRPDRCVLLTGSGGDDLLGPTRQAFIDFLWRGAPRRALSAARRMGGGGIYGTAAFAAGEIARALAPSIARTLYRRARGRTSTWPTWLCESAGRELDSWHRRDVEAYLTYPAPNELQRGLALGIMGRWGIQAVGARFDAFCRARGADCRFAFRDRRVAEFLLAAPSEERFDGSMSKGIVRRAMRGIVPERVRMRGDVVDFKPVFLTALNGSHREAYRALANTSVLEECGLVKAGTLLRMLTPVTDPAPIYEILSVEVAVRTIRSQHATNARAPESGGLHPGNH